MHKGLEFPTMKFHIHFCKDGIVCSEQKYTHDIHCRCGLEPYHGRILSCDKAFVGRWFYPGMRL